MRVAIACDHAGFPLKAGMVQTILQHGHEVIDLGAYEIDPFDDYPDYALKVGETVLKGEAERGILLCGSGVGVAIAANKINGIYAGLCEDTYSAHQGVEHDAMNVLCLGARVTGPSLANEIVMSFLQAVVSSEERHVRRVKKTRRIEAGL
jgi:ribose 5-phosphate isomerase B